MRMCVYVCMRVVIVVVKKYEYDKENQGVEIHKQLYKTIWWKCINAKLRYK